MSKYIKVTINNEKEFTGRLIGIITQFECRAIINTSDAARKIFSSKSMSISSLPLNCSGKRLVIATSNYSPDQRREIYISPAISFLSWQANNRIYRCDDGSKYKLEEI